MKHFLNNCHLNKNKTMDNLTNYRNCDFGGGIISVIERQIISLIRLLFEGGSGVMVIIVGNGQGDTSSNPGRD